MPTLNQKIRNLTSMVRHRVKKDCPVFKAKQKAEACPRSQRKETHLQPSMKTYTAPTLMLKVKAQTMERRTYYHMPRTWTEPPKSSAQAPTTSTHHHRTRSHRLCPRGTTCLGTSTSHRATTSWRSMTYTIRRFQVRGRSHGRNCSLIRRKSRIQSDGLMLPCNRLRSMRIRSRIEYNS